MPCQICNEKSSFYPLCAKCFKLRDAGKISKCKDCGIWKNDIREYCKDCLLKKTLKIIPKIPEYHCDDGHWVKSKSEKAIDDWLYRNKIFHAYEQKVRISESLITDFFLPELNVFIEHWGYNDDKYNARRKEKTTLYNKYKLNLIELTEEDSTHLDEVLSAKLIKYGQKFY
jgi:hypothetical protein